MNINPPQYFEKSFKPLKIYYNNEMRWILKAPSNYWSLCQSICEAFENNLPNFWTLQYTDTDGDLIFLANNDDYEGMIEDMLENSPTVKIYVRPVDKRSRKLSVENIRILAAPKEDIPCYQPIPDQEELLAKLNQPEQPEEEEKEGKKEEEDSSDSFEKLMENEEVINIYNSADSSISFSKVSDSEEGKPKADIREISLSGSFEKLEKELSLDQEPEKLRKKSVSFDMETKKEDTVKENVGDTLDLDIPIIPLMNEKGRGQDSSSFFSFNGGEGNNYKMRKERPIHEDTICSRCGMNPIVGVRYNCPICKDVDYCEKCEGTFEHPHPFFKIKSANHSPKDVVSLIVAENIIEAEGLSKNMKDEMVPIVNFLKEKLFGTKEPVVREDLEAKEDCEVNFLREKLFGTEELEVREDLEEEKEPIEKVKEGEKLDKSFSFHENEIVCEKVKDEEPSESSSDSKIEMTKYPQRVYDLAKEVLEIFPDADLDGLLDFIDRSPKLTLSDIIENFMLL